MTREVPWAQPSDTARDAARRMREHHVGFLPVCDRTGRLLGVVTDRDMAYRLIAEDHPATTHVREVMSQEYPRCLESDDLGVATSRLAGHGERPLLVTDGTGHLRGMIDGTVLAHQGTPKAARSS